MSPTQVFTRLEARQERELAHDDRAQHVALGRAHAIRGHLAVRVDDGLELLIEVLDRRGVALMEEAAHLLPAVVMRVGSAPYSMQEQAFRLSLILHLAH